MKVASADRNDMRGASFQVSWENVTQTFKFKAVARPKNVTSDGKSATGTLLEGEFTSSVDGSQLATVKLESDPGGQVPSTAKVVFKTGEVFELKAQDFSPVMPATPGLVPPATYAAPRVSATPN